jgi:hypothetical protein
MTTVIKALLLATLLAGCSSQTLQTNSVLLECAPDCHTFVPPCVVIAHGDLVPCVKDNL